MENQNVPQEIFNPISDNVRKLAALFPTAVKDGEIDFAALKQELGDFTETKAEKYELSWSGKADAKKAALMDIVGRTLTFDPKDSKHADTTGNLYIEGDNLEILKLLRENYYGAVKMVYLDPPYNTGNDFVYRDKFAMDSFESDEDEGDTADGERLIVNQKSSNRYHANWLTMMYPRLKIAKDLLADDGVIFMSIDDNEVDNLKKMCNELFGDENFLGIITWESKTKCQNTKTAKRQLQKKQEYILAYKKQPQRYEFILEMNSEREYPNSDERGEFRIEQVGEMSASGIRGRNSMVYPIKGVYPKEGNQWKYGVETIEEFDQRKDLFTENNKVYFKIRADDEDDKMNPFWTLISKEIGTAETAKKELESIIGKHGFETVKPIELLKKLIYHVCTSDSSDIVLDFFSGTSSTAHAVMQLNAEDGGNRKFIMVQVPEKCDEKSEAFKAGYKNICDIGKERIRRAGEKIKAEVETANMTLKLDEEPKTVPDIGFKVFRANDTTIRWTHLALTQHETEQFQASEYMFSDKQKLDFMPHATDIDVVYEVLLRQRDIPLSAHVEKLSTVGDRTYHFAYQYIVCLEENITKDMLEQLASVEPLPSKIILRDSAFNDDINLKDESIRLLQALIARNTGANKKSYTVEFI